MTNPFSSLTDDLLGPTTPQPQAPPPPALPKLPPKMRSFTDVPAMRTAIFDSALQAAQKIEPVSNPRFSLKLNDVAYEGPERFGPKEHKQAILSGGSLGRKLRGTWHLHDAQGNVVDKKRTTLAHIPYLTDDGTYVHNGNDYSLSNQTRLQPGIYTREKENGELEAHCNVSRGMGHRIFMDPETGSFKIQLAQARIPLYPLLKAVGVADDRMKMEWGPYIYAQNVEHNTDPSINKIYERLLGKYAKKEDGAPPPSQREKKEAIAKAFEAMEVDPEVTKRTLGKPYANVGKDTLMSITNKLVRVNRGEDQTDDRDAMHFQSLHGPEDHFAERFKKARGVAQKLLWKASARGNLSHVSSGAYNDAVHGTLLHSGLSSPLEETNPLEILDHLTRVTRMGEGGIPSIDSIPDSSRSVQPSQLGYIDFLRSPESERVGVDARLARTAMKGENGKIYMPVRNLQTGQIEHKTPQEIADTVLSFPGEHESGRQHLDVLHKGALGRLPREQAQYQIPHMEDTFSPLANLVVGKSGIKGQRAVMAARMISQALPLTNPEAPFVRNGVSGQPDRSFEEEYARHAGARHSEVTGRVESVEDGKVVIRTKDGPHEVELHSNFPYNRKTFLHQTPAVKPGDFVQPGQLLATSNYTDDKGHVALGKNLRTAYTSWRGLNYEDASVISESAAKKLASEHMYQHGYEYNDQTHKGKNAFLSTFGSKYPKSVMQNFTPDGVIKPGTVVQPNEPLILAMEEKQGDRKSLLRGKSSQFKDASEIWEHHSPGVVTDVHASEKGVNVVVKSISPMQVGDKLCYSSDTDVLTSDGWKTISEVTLRDKIASLNDDGVLEYIRPSALHRYEHSGRMYALQTTQVDLCVTDNHHLYAKKRYRENFELIRADELFGKRYSLKADAIWCGRDPEYVTLPPMIVKAGQFGRGQREMPARHIPVHTYAVMLGLFVSEGHLINYAPAGNYGMGLTQVKPGGREKMEAGLTEAGIKFVNFPNGVQILGKQLLEHFKYMSGAKNKRLPNFIWSWSKDTLREIYKWAMFGDGGETGTGHAYFTSSPGLADDMQRLCLHIGYSARVEKRHDGEWQMIKGKRCWVDPQYRVAIYRKKHTPEINHGHVNSQGGQSESWTDYNGLVYCVTLPRNHVLYVRRNGRPCWCGNSGDKGDKSIVSAIIPDHKMPHDEDGNPYEMLANPLGVISRSNPSQIVVAALGKIAEKTGKPYVLPDFAHIDDLTEYAIKELQKNGIPDTQTIIDPESGRRIPDVFTGNRWYMKLHHLAESKNQGRGLGAYTSEMTPARGGPDGSKRIGILENNAFLSHGASNFLRDSGLVRGQSNPVWWQQYMSGHAPGKPTVPHMYHKFVNYLKAAGANPVREGSKTHIMAMTNSDVNELTQGRELKNAETVDWKTLAPVKGGLFDEELTGGHLTTKGGGNLWAHIKLHEPMPSPIMEEPIRRILGLTKEKFLNVIGGEDKLNGKTGPQAITNALSKIDLPQLLAETREAVQSGRKTVRDDAVRKLGYLKDAERLGIHPKDWVLAKVPVLPPAFRPVSVMQGTSKTPLVDDANYTYKELFDANHNLKTAATHLGDNVGTERRTLYNAFKAVVGLGDPIGAKNQERQVTGVLKHVFGTAPKYGCYDDQTELLTKDGWKLFADLSEGVEVATLNQETGAFEWQTPDGIYSWDYKGELFWFKTIRGIDCVVTPNHRNWVRYRPKGETASDLEEGWRIERAYQTAATTNRKWFRTAASEWRGHRNRPGFLPESCDLLDFAAFVGWWAAEGWLGEDVSNAQLCQGAKNSKNCVEIDRVVNAMGLKFGRGEYWKEGGFSPQPTLLVQWSVHSKELAAWLKTNVGSLAECKTLSAEVKDWDSDLLLAFFYGYLGGDGGRRHLPRVNDGGVTHKNKSHIADPYQTCSSTSSKLADDIVEICCKLGITGRKKIQTEEILREDGSVYKLLWRVNLSGSRYVVLEGEGQQGIVDYDGRVHCVSVPNGVIYVRRNGKPFFSGNTMQRRLLGSSVDLVGRSVIVPDPDLDMDSAGIPENTAWSMYSPAIVRRLVRRGLPRHEALRAIDTRSEVARQALLGEMEDGVVVLNRAPTLHRFGLMAFRPKLTKGDVLKVTPIMCAPAGGDFDGDAMQIHIPSTLAEKNDALEKMLPSKNLFSVSNFKAIYKPTMEYAGGLYEASARSDNGKHLRHYEDTQAVRHAVHRGEINYDHPIVVHKH